MIGAPAVLRWRKRAMFIGCPHGRHVNEAAFAEVLRFAEDFRPHHRCHLGDNWDATAFRKGAAGTADGNSDVGEDVEAGTSILRRFMPTIFWRGNHEERFWNLSRDPDARIACAAKHVVGKIEDLCRELRCQLVPYGSTATRDGWVLFGDTLAGHGYMYNEQCTRDHVEWLGGHRCIHAHDHKAKMQPGRCIDAPMGYSVGTLATIRAMEYAGAKRSTSAWCGGYVWGEYGEGWSRWHLEVIHSETSGETWQTPKADATA